MELFLKIPSEMANSVHPDQTAPSGAIWYESALFACAILSEILLYKIWGHLPYSSLLPVKKKKHKKYVLTFHASCLQRRQIVWNVKTCFLRKIVLGSITQCDCRARVPAWPHVFHRDWSCNHAFPHPFCWFKKRSCQLLAKVCGESTCTG